MDITRGTCPPSLPEYYRFTYHMLLLLLLLLLLLSLLLLDVETGHIISFPSSILMKLCVLKVHVGNCGHPGRHPVHRFPLHARKSALAGQQGQVRFDLNPGWAGGRAGGRAAVLLPSSAGRKRQTD